MTTKSFSPTAEQQAALDAFATGKDMVIEAGAGTGKTSTLRLMAESTNRRGIYVAYNKSIQMDADQDFPANAQCRTAHSLANRAVRRMPNGSRLMNRINGGRVPSRQAVAILGIPSGGFEISSDNRLEAWVISRSAFDAVRNFCNSADSQVTSYHVPKMEGVEDQAAYKEFVLPFARKAWADLNDPNGKLKFEHDHYLKIWALTGPKLDGDFIMLDEAQDANPVIAQIVGNQTHMQQIMVGDRCQAIFGWRGAIDAMSNFQAAHFLMLSQSFRFGPLVAEQANKCLELLDSPLRLKGFDQIDSKLFVMDGQSGPEFTPDAILCRTNAAVIQCAMSAQAKGKKVAIVGGTSEISRFTLAAKELMAGKKVSHADLVAFKSWEEVTQYAQSDEGRDLRIMVKLINDYGVDAIMEVCSASIAKEENADLIVSTAHKAKGREWNRVQIAADFKAPQEGEQPSRPEIMLIYVAVTRAKLELDDSGISWIYDVKKEVTV